MELRGGLPGGRRELRTCVGPLGVVVTEVPGRSLTEREWDHILLARRSYTTMWGGGREDLVVEDPLDGRDSSPYDTRHYLAWVSDGGDPYKLVTMRTVRLLPSKLTDEQRADPLALLPVDIQLWRVRGDGGRGVPLWEALRAHTRRLAPRDELAEFRIASMERIATSPYGEPKRTTRERERTAIAFAAIQLLATYADPNLLHVWTLCAELRDRVLGVVDVNGEYVPPAFTRTEDTLGLPRGSVGLDVTLPVVQEHKATFPGYFVDNDDAARLITGLLDERRVTVADLSPTIAHLVEQETLLGRDTRQFELLASATGGPDHHRLAEILTRPHLFKYLVPLIASDRPLTRISTAELRRRLVWETMDGPFSSTMMPWQSAASARAILEVAEEKYADAEPRRSRVALISPWRHAAAGTTARRPRIAASGSSTVRASAGRSRRWFSGEVAIPH